MITIFGNEKLIERLKDYDVVLVGMGINNSFSNGFASYIKVHFPDVVRREQEVSPYGDRRKIGSIVPIKCADGPIFVMCYVHGGGYTKKKEYIDYDALEKCLEKAAKKYEGKSIASTLIGAFPYDGNGDRDRIVGIFEKAFFGSKIDVYAKDQGNFDEIVRKELMKAYADYKSGKISIDEYTETKRRLVWKRKNGIFIPMRPDFEPKKAFSWEDLIRLGGKTKKS